jgi:PAS domain-containing protein
MSQQPLALDAVPVLQPSGNPPRLSSRDLHPRLQQQLAEAGRSGGAGIDLAQLLPLVSNYYEQLDDERRGIVRSMQLIADEARSYGEGLGGIDPGHWQVILDHVKDVVITAGADGAVKIFNPTGERVFGHSRADIIGESIARLLPDLPVQGSVEKGLQALVARADAERGDLRAHRTS